MTSVSTGAAAPSPVQTETAPYAAGTTPDPLPKYGRAPAATALTTLSKPQLYDLANRGLIRSISLREAGQRKGTRIFDLHSLRDFLESRATGGAPDGTAVTSAGQ